MPTTPEEHRRGLILALGASVIWGLVPVYFKLLGGVPPVEVVAHRILWSVVLLITILAATRRLPALAAALTDIRVLRALLLSAVLIGGNWLLYIWAVASGKLLAASFGYFLNPLVNVVLGVTVLRERLSGAQKAAVGLAAVGVAIAATGAIDDLGIGVALALSFAFYGLIRKLTPVGAVEGLAVETIVLAPLCAGWIAWHATAGTLAFGRETGIDALLIGSALVTSAPLMMYAASARRLPYATMGVLQYIAPSMVLVLGVTVYDEPLVPAMAVAFVFIWAGLAVFTVDLVRRSRMQAAS